MSLFWFQILFYALLSLSGVLETCEILSKGVNSTTLDSRWSQLHQAKSIEHRNVSESKTIMCLTQVCLSLVCLWPEDKQAAMALKHETRDDVSTSGQALPWGSARRRAASRWPACRGWPPGSTRPPPARRTSSPGRARARRRGGSRRTCPACSRWWTRYWSRSRRSWCSCPRPAASSPPGGRGSCDHVRGAQGRPRYRR